MAKSELKLLGAWPSPYVLRVQVALNLKGIEYEFIEETMNPKSQILLELNPVYKKIPVLIHHDKPICESLVIVEYIDEVWASTGPSMLPSDPYDRAIARFWVAYLDDKLLQSVRGMLRPEGDDQEKKCIKQVQEGMILLEDAFEICSKGNEFFGGDEIGLVDIIFGSFLGWIKALEEITEAKLIDEYKSPKLKKWVETFGDHVAVKHVMPDTDKLTELARVRIAKWKADHAYSF